VDTVDYEIIVVDNDSTDGFIKIVKNDIQCRPEKVLPGG
jgi:glycosyltransferase involved in cell wall biosynthesis